jgi:hypothetical protein
MTSTRRSGLHGVPIYIIFNCTQIIFSSEVFWDVHKNVCKDSNVCNYLWSKFSTLLWGLLTTVHGGMARWNHYQNILVAPTVLSFLASNTVYRPQSFLCVLVLVSSSAISRKSSGALDGARPWAGLTTTCMVVSGTGGCSQGNPRLQHSYF